MSPPHSQTCSGGQRAPRTFRAVALPRAECAVKTTSCAVCHSLQRRGELGWYLHWRTRRRCSLVFDCSGPKVRAKRGAVRRVAVHVESRVAREAIWARCGGKEVLSVRFLGRRKSEEEFWEELGLALPENDPSGSSRDAHAQTRAKMSKETLNGVVLTDAENSDDIRERGYNICKEYLNGAWRLITPDKFIIKKLSGGLSNFLYYCALPDDQPPAGNEPTKVLLRIYGQTHGEGDLQTNCITECVIFTLLSENNRGPRLYGIFPGGRLEEYIPARPLTTAELSDDHLSLLIADSVAEIHSMQVPISKEPRWLWATIEKWLRRIDGSKALLKVKNILGTSLKEELRWLRNYLSKVHSPVVFCHNDLQEGNILKKGDNETTNLVIIDFEYCAYNHRAFDLANHFCESMYDYSNEEWPYFWSRPENYPGRAAQESFVRRYLSRLSRSEGAEEEEVEAVLEEIRAYTLASHMFWGIWSVVNSIVSTVAFDYWNYGKARFTAYLEHKTALCRDEETRLMLSEPALQGADNAAGIRISRTSRSSSLIETN